MPLKMVRHTLSRQLKDGTCVFNGAMGSPLRNHSPPWNNLTLLRWLNLQSPKGLTMNLPLLGGFHTPSEKGIGLLPLWIPDITNGPISLELKFQRTWMIASALTLLIIIPCGKMQLLLRLKPYESHLKSDMVNIGVVPKRLKDYRVLMWSACLYTKATKKPWRDKQTLIYKPKFIVSPGELISVEQFESPTPGLVARVVGRLTTKRYKYATFRDG